MRQGFDPAPGASVSSLAYEYPASWQIPGHSHRSDQLIYATSGVMELSMAQTRLLVPPLFAVWVAADTVHSIRMPYAVSMRTLYLRPRLVRSQTSRVLHVTPFLRELILEITRIGSLQTRRRLHVALRDVLVAQIDTAAPIPMSLTVPDDPRARQLAEATLVDPTGRQKLEMQCRRFGMSTRTLQRTFRRELGIDYDTWRRQVRLLKAVELLASGASVRAAAEAVGYRQTSTFIALFAANFGLTPKAWIVAHSPKAALRQRGADDS